VLKASIGLAKADAGFVEDAGDELFGKETCMSVQLFNKSQSHSYDAHANSAKHVKNTKHEKNVLLGSHVHIAVLTTSRMYHILEYVPMYLEHLPSGVP
jgi:hypothetical protein